LIQKPTGIKGTIFAGVGITEAIHTKDNEDGMIQTLRYMEEENHGLIFTNLVEFDSKWGHRNDPEGYGKGLEAFDVQFGTLLTKLRDDDLLIINADHGCDPTTPGTDHTREYVPLLVYNKKMGGAVDLGTRETFADVGQTIGEIFGMKQLEIGTSFLKKLKL
jgi:phosphopentomutase